MSSNICKFLSAKNVEQEINIINFVYEKKRHTRQRFKCDSTYRMHMVMSGKGVLVTPYETHGLTVGDISGSTI